MRENRFSFSTVFHSLRFLSDDVDFQMDHQQKFLSPFSLFFFFFLLISLFYSIFNFLFPIFSHLFLDYIFLFFSFQSKKDKFCVIAFVLVEGENGNLVYDYIKYDFLSLIMSTYNDIIRTNEKERKRMTFRYYDY